MALNLGCPEGSTVLVGGRPLTVEAVKGFHHAELRDDQGKLHHISDQKSVEIYPDVFVSVGLKNQMGVLSLVFEAPRSILILRKELHDRAKENEVCASS